MTDRRLGAYVLPGDTVWLQRTVRQYYPMLDALVVPVPEDGLGWTGVAIPVEEAVALIRAIDTRGIMRVVSGTWIDKVDPMRADTAQRQQAIDALSGDVDWIIQLDNDEYLPRPEMLLSAIDEAERQGIDAVEWPMRVLYRRTRARVFEVVTAEGRPHYEYPGPILVKAGARLGDARRVVGDFLRLVVRSDSGSLQVSRDPEAGEHRIDFLEHDDAIVHNSWARQPSEIRQKMASWGHSTGSRFSSYYWLRWWPAPVLWRLQRDLHPFARGLWPAIRPRPKDGPLAD